LKEKKVTKCATGAEELAPSKLLYTLALPKERDMKPPMAEIK